AESPFDSRKLDMHFGSLEEEGLRASEAAYFEAKRRIEDIQIRERQQRAKMRASKDTIAAPHQVHPEQRILKGQKNPLNPRSAVDGNEIISWGGRSPTIPSLHPE